MTTVARAVTANKAENDFHNRVYLLELGSVGEASPESQLVKNLFSSTMLLRLYRI
jgi:hypothetical protein